MAQLQKTQKPPKTPTELEDLDRAIMLLGNRAQGNLRKKNLQEELVQLVGKYPNKETAAAWKRHLKQARKLLET